MPLLSFMCLRKPLNPKGEPKTTRSGVIYSERWLSLKFLDTLQLTKTSYKVERGLCELDFWCSNYKIDRIYLLHMPNHPVKSEKSLLDPDWTQGLPLPGQKPLSFQATKSITFWFIRADTTKLDWLSSYLELYVATYTLSKFHLGVTGNNAKHSQGAEDIMWRGLLTLGTKCIRWWIIVAGHGLNLRPSTYMADTLPTKLQSHMTDYLLIYHHYTRTQNISSQVLV